MARKSDSDKAKVTNGTKSKASLKKPTGDAVPKPKSRKTTSTNASEKLVEEANVSSKSKSKPITATKPKAVSKKTTASKPKRTTKKSTVAEVLAQNPCLNGFGPPSLLPDLKKQPKAGPREYALPVAGSIWTKKRLSVSFFDAGVTEIPNIGDEIMKIADEWTEDILLKFERVGDNDTSADIRVGFRDEGKYNSVIGTQAQHGTAPSMNLGFRANSESWTVIAERRRLVLHEFGHALGLDHEHKHPSLGLDENAMFAHYKRALAGYPDDAIRFQFKRLAMSEIDPRAKETAKNPDLQSVMMYPFPVEVVGTKFGPRGIEGGKDLSETDKQGVKDLYGDHEQFRATPRGLQIAVNGKKKAYYLFGNDEAIFYFQILKDGKYEIRISSDSGEDVIDPFARIPTPYNLQTSAMMLGSKFDFYEPEENGLNRKNHSIPDLGFTVEVNKFPSPGDDPSTFKKVLDLKSGRYFMTATNANVDLIENSVCRFIIEIISPPSKPQ